MKPYLRAANVKNGELDLTNVLSMNFSPKEQAIFSLKSGDVLVTEGSGSIGSVGATSVWRGELSETVCFQNTLLRLRPRVGTDSNFLGWWARAAHASGLFASVAAGANIYHLSAERVRALPFDLPPLEEQRRIAGFLDAETARIDRLASFRRHQLALLSVRENSVLAANLTSKRDTIKVKYLLEKMTSGPRGWGDYLADKGTLFLRIANIPRQGIDLKLEALARVTAPEGSERERTRTHEGDVLVSITADIGSVAVVDARAVDGNVSQHIALLRPRKHLCQPRWLAYAIRSPQARQQLLMSGYGGTKMGLGLADVGNLVVPRLSFIEQTTIVEQMDLEIGAIRKLEVRITEQVELLEERRRAIVTAAVTGKLDVTTARSVV